MLAAFAGDEVAAVFLDDGLEALGAVLGVGEDPVDGLRLAAALDLPLLPHGARARRVRIGGAAGEAEAHAAGALHLAVPLAGDVHADRAPAVRHAGAPLHEHVAIEVGLEQEAVEAPGRVRVPPAKEAMHHGLVADGRALHPHAPDLLLAAVHRHIEVLRPTWTNR